MTEPLDEPLIVVGACERDDRLVEAVDVAVEAGPQALLFEGADPTFDAAVALGLAGIEAEAPSNEDLASASTTWNDTAVSSAISSPPEWPASATLSNAGPRRPPIV